MRLVYLVVVLAVDGAVHDQLHVSDDGARDDPLVPRAIFGVLNTLLFFPSGAIYPTEGFPIWLRWISVVDPFTYAVHALRNLLLRDSGIEGIYRDVLILLGFAILMVAGSIALFKRQI